MKCERCQNPVDDTGSVGEFHGLPFAYCHACSFIALTVLAFIEEDNCDWGIDQLQTYARNLSRFLNDIHKLTNRKGHRTYVNN